MATGKVQHIVLDVPENSRNSCQMRLASFIASTVCIAIGSSTISLGACTYEVPTGTSGVAPQGCGDGIVEDGHEQCDDKNQRDGDGCTWACQLENHDHCDAPVLVMDYESITILGSSEQAIDDINMSSSIMPCTEEVRPGPDLIYPVKPNQDGTLVVTLKADYQGHYLHIRTACNGSTVADEIACDFGAIGEEDLAEVDVTKDNMIYVIVDGGTNVGGKFSLQLELQK